jgi:hypothetical protein
METYYDFFSSYGTHVVTCVALGGVIRVVSQASKSSSERSGDNVPQGTPDSTIGHAPDADQYGPATSQKRHVTIFRDGGGAVASRLTHILEQKFGASSLQDGSPVDLLSGWADVRMDWINELQKDPVFCSDDPNTEYQWLHTLGGLTEQQREDLRLASESCLKVLRVPFTINNPEPMNMKGSAHQKDRGTGSERTSRSDMDLLREQNQPGVFTKVKMGFERARRKLRELHTRRCYYDSRSHGRRSSRAESHGRRSRAGSHGGRLSMLDQCSAVMFHILVSPLCSHI